MVMREITQYFFIVYQNMDYLIFYVFLLFRSCMTDTGVVGDGLLFYRIVCCCSNSIFSNKILY